MKAMSNFQSLISRMIVILFVISTTISYAQTKNIRKLSSEEVTANEKEIKSRINMLSKMKESLRDEIIATNQKIASLVKTDSTEYELLSALELSDFIISEFSDYKLFSLEIFYNYYSTHNPDNDTRAIDEDRKTTFMNAVNKFYSATDEERKTYLDKETFLKELQKYIEEWDTPSDDPE